MSTLSNSSSQSITTPTTLGQRLTATLASVLLGCALVYFAGFSHLEIVHNAAHDTRHSAAFPCH